MLKYSSHSAMSGVTDWAAPALTTTSASIRAAAIVLIQRMSPLLHTHCSPRPRGVKRGAGRSPSLAGRQDTAPERHVQMTDAGAEQRVDHRVDHRGRGADRGRLADAL